MPRYVPARGDFVWLDFHSQVGHQQKGRRPALVVSPRDYNAKASLALCCPITSKIKGYPFETQVDPPDSVRGVILCDQVRSLDWRARRATLIGRASRQCLDDVMAKIESLLHR